MKMTLTRNRRAALLGAFCILVLLVIVFIKQSRGPVQVPAATSSAISAPAHSWPLTTPEEQGLDSNKLAEGLQAVRKQNINIDSLLVIRNGSVLLDAYFYPYDGKIVHDLASVTKSVMTTLIAIAADRGKLQLDQPMVSFFPQRTIANLGARKEHITVRHLAGMVNGMESGCMEGDEATLDAMRASADWVQSALDRKMAEEPGTSFCYDSPGMHLLSAILQKATGMTALDFARENLFEPLGIRDVIWESDPQGYTHGWGDLHLQPRDAAKLGYLWLNNGVWEGKQIVSAEWVKESAKARSKARADDYGYGWWVSPDSFYAMGRGGQNIKVMPSMNMVVVTTGGGLEYDQVVPFLKAAITDSGKPLPANPAGVARLNAMLSALVQPQTPWPVTPLPDTAKAISGKTYAFPRNPSGVETLMLDFYPSQPLLRIEFHGRDEICPIGLDGSYRLSTRGRGVRGYWVDSQTFALEIFDIGVSTHHFRFKDDRLTVDMPRLGAEYEGQVIKP